MRNNRLTRVLLAGAMAFMLIGSQGAVWAAPGTGSTTATTPAGTGPSGGWHGAHTWIDPHTASLSQILGAPAATAKKLGMSMQQLAQALRGGQSLAQLYRAHGLSLQAQASKVFANVRARADSLAQRGLLSPAMEQTMLRQFAAHEKLHAGTVEAYFQHVYGSGAAGTAGRSGPEACTAGPHIGCGLAQTWQAVYGTGSSGGVELTHALNAVSFAPGTADGWAVGDHATIVATVDGGATWSEQQAPNQKGTPNDIGTCDLTGVSFVNPLDGWAVDACGDVIRTQDGGAHWTVISASWYALPTPIGQSLQADAFDFCGVDCDFPAWDAVQFVNPQDGWIVGEYGIILATTNGGLSWTDQTRRDPDWFDLFSGCGADITGLSFINASTGWAVSDAGFVIATFDGGRTWVDQTSNFLVPNPPDFAPTFLGVSVSAAGTGAVVDDQGDIFATADFGQTWSQVAGPGPQLNAASFADAADGWVVGNGQFVASTADGGQTWTYQPLSLGGGVSVGNLYGVAAPGPQQVVAVGSGHDPSGQPVGVILTNGVPAGENVVWGPPALNPAPTGNTTGKLTVSGAVYSDAADTTPVTGGNVTLQAFGVSTPDGSEYGYVPLPLFNAGSCPSPFKLGTSGCASEIVPLNGAGAFGASDLVVPDVQTLYEAGVSYIIMQATVTGTGVSASVLFPVTAPIVDGLSSPATGPAAGGSRVVIYGQGFTLASGVSFGGTALTPAAPGAPLTPGTFRVTDDGEIVASSPPQGSSPAGVQVTVTGLDGLPSSLGPQATVADDTFTYASSPATAFPGVTLSPAAATFGTGGPASVTVGAVAPPDGLEGWTVRVAYDASRLTATGCTAASGSSCSIDAAGGTVTVTGAVPRPLSGTVPLATIHFETGGTPGATVLATTVDSFVDYAGDQVTAATAGAAWQIAQQGPLSVTPPGGPGTGGTPVALGGSGFAAGDSVSIGGNAASVGSVSADGKTIQATTPPDGVLFGDVNGDGQVSALDVLCILDAAAGESPASCPGLTTQADVTVNETNGQSVTDPGGFTYWNYDLTGTDGGTANATDALCAAEIVAGDAAGACGPHPASGHGVARHANSVAAHGTTGAGAVAVDLTGPAVVPAGGSATFDLGLVAPPSGVGAWEADVSYDPSLLRVVGCTPLGGGACNLRFGPGTVRLAGVSAAGVTGDVNLASLRFQAVGKAGSTVPLGLTVVSLAGPGGAPLQADTTPATLAIVSAQPVQITGGPGGGGVHVAHGAPFR